MSDLQGYLPEGYGACRHPCPAGHHLGGHAYLAAWDARRGRIPDPAHSAGWPCPAGPLVVVAVPLTGPPPCSARRPSYPAASSSPCPVISASHPVRHRAIDGIIHIRTKNARKTSLRAFLCTGTVQREAPHGPPGGHFRAEEANPEIFMRSWPQWPAARPSQPGCG